MVVVVDGDLRASEAAVMEALLQLGKRMLLVLNKCDLRGIDEQQRLLDVLRSRCRGLIADADVIPCSAAPQSIPRPESAPATASRCSGSGATAGGSASCRW